MTDTAAAGFEGFAPQVKIEGPIKQPGHVDAIAEDEKYRRMWERPEYRIVAPGEHCAQLFLEQARPRQGSEVIDFGTGTGRGAFMLATIGGMKVRMLDFAENCLDPDIRQMLETQAHVLSFAKQDLKHPIPWVAEYGFCTDVMEHIPAHEVDLVLHNVLKAAQHCFFQISCEDDVCGKLIGHPLHLSVHPYDWWLKKLRDEYECHVHWSQDAGSHCLFYVTAWWSGNRMTSEGALNVEEQVVRDNVAANIKRNLKQISPHAPNDTRVLILGGGPSLRSSLDEIKTLVAYGAKVVTLNGAYNWAVENGLQVGAQIICDARPHNARFVAPVQEKCKYFLASQCDASVYDALPPDVIYQWHTTAEMFKELLDAQFEGKWFGIFGGSTVLLRAIPLLRMLGFVTMDLFGCDSCLMNGEHHSYAQAENDGQRIIPAMLGGKTFQCVPFHISQAQEFIDLIRVFGNNVELEVHGEGLLAWVLEHAANVDIENELKALENNPAVLA